MVVLPGRGVVVAAPLTDLPVISGKTCFCSIVIPVYQDDEALLLLLADLQSMRAHGYQIIVVNGQQPVTVNDNFLTMTDQYIFASKGRAAQMNAGAAIADGQILWFLHADSRLDVDACHHQILQISLTEKSWGFFAVRLSGAALIYRLIEKLMNLRSCLTAIATGDQGIFVKKSAFDKAGAYPSQPLMEDIEISKRLKTLSKPLCATVRIVTSSRRWQQRGVIKTILLMWWLRLAYWSGAPASRIAQWYR